MTIRTKEAHDGVPVADICRRAGISPATCFNWKKKYERLAPLEMRRLKQFEDGNTKLRKRVADLSLDREVLQDIVRRKIRDLVASASASVRMASCPHGLSAALSPSFA